MYLYLYNSEARILKILSLIDFTISFTYNGIFVKHQPLTESHLLVALDLKTQTQHILNVFMP